MPSFLSNLQINQMQLVKPVIENTTPAPSSPVKGQLYYDTVANTLYWYNNSTWIAAQSGAVSFGSPGSSAVADIVAAGVSTNAARADHVHGREAFGATVATTSYGLSVANGVAATLARSDHAHGTPALPTAAGVGAVANSGVVPNIGSGTTGSRPAAGTVGALYLDITTFLLWRDNGSTWDQVDGFAAPSASAVGAAQGAGSATTFARSDHVHAREAFAIVGSSAVGDVAAAGSATSVAHSDHVHAREAFGNAVAQTAFGSSATNGVATTVIRSDHAHGTPTHDNAAHSAITLNSLASPTAPPNMGAQRVTNAADPTSATDLATKQYVDAAAVGIDFKPSVRVASTANITIASALVNASTIDGISVATGDRVLLKNQTTASENGIYIVAAAGAASRSTDADTSAEVTSGILTFVEQGTVNGGQQWILTTTGVIVLNTTALVFTQFSGASTLTAGAGLTAAGNAFAVGAGAGITVGADTVAIDTTVVVRKFAATVGDGAATSIVVTHNLGTTDVVVAIYAVGSPFAEVICDVQHTSTNTITLLFAVAPASNAYRVAVQG